MSLGSISSPTLPLNSLYQCMPPLKSLMIKKASQNSQLGKHPKKVTHLSIGMNLGECLLSKIRGNAILDMPFVPQGLLKAICCLRKNHRSCPNNKFLIVLATTQQWDAKVAVVLELFNLCKKKDL